MKHILILFASILIFTSAKAQRASEFFDTLQHNFGVLHQHDSAVHYFHFTNKSQTDLVIEDVKTTCSCTASEYPQKPVKPGEKAYIKISFDPTDKEGHYAKGVNIMTNLGEINFIIFAEVHKH